MQVETAKRTADGVGNVTRGLAPSWVTDVAHKEAHEREEGHVVAAGDGNIEAVPVH